MALVAITRTLPDAGLESLREAGHDLRIRRDDAPPSPPELHDLVAGASAVITLLSDTVDDAFLDAAGPQLEVVANYAVGHDNIDLEACRARGIAVANTPGVLDEATADLAWTLLLAVARRVLEGHALASSGEWRGWHPMQLLGAPLHGRRFGVVGLGRIGAAAARRARGFGMEVVYHSRSRDRESEAATGALWLPLPELLETSDVVSLHCPLTPETRHLIDEEALARMRPHAILVNTARGPVVDERALARALERGTIGGAGLDVFEEEPRISPALREAPNVVLTPHLGSATTWAREAMARLAAEAVVAVLAGREVPHLVVKSEHPRP